MTTIASSSPTPAETHTERGAFALTPAQLRRRCDPDHFSFATTTELTPRSDLIGRGRAADAITFGLAISERGYHIFAAGPPGAGKTTTVRALLEAAAGQRPSPPDWAYVHNFRDPSRPRALRLLPGQGRELRDGLRRLVLAARREIPRAFESEEYIARREAIIGGMTKRREQGMAQLAARAQAAGFGMQATPMGIMLVPVMGNRPLTDEDLAALRPEMRAMIDQRREEIEGEIRAFLKEMRAVERDTRDRLEAQDREVALHAVGGVVEDLAEHYTDQPEVSALLDEVREGILADLALFRGHPLSHDPALPEPASEADPQHLLHERAFRKYELNVVVDNGGATGAPVIFEVNPTFPNMVGRIEREAVLGALMTDHTLIGPGALHRANGGYLVLRATDLLRAPMAWEALKRALRRGELDIEDVTEALGLAGTRGLRPDPLPLDVKVVLIGDLGIYQLLYTLDPEFRELFKVRADFDIELERTPENEEHFAALLACAGEGSRPLDRTAVARIVEESSRLVADQRKLSVQFGPIRDLVREANHWAGLAGSAVIDAAHVRQAVEQRRHRTGMIGERLREMVSRGVLLVRPEGQAAGQVLGLAVSGIGETLLGRPSRITATAGAGRDGLVDIERQVELGGRIHSKGVLILGGYLTDHYAGEQPLALSARLVFEQSYEEVEGDSASLAELLALLSRLADVPLNQAIAVTGSVNQRGDVQAVGGVNEKIEGFYDTCVALGLSGEQGVILPAANVEHLMLRDEIVAAATARSFTVYAVGSVDQALTLLTGMPAATIHERVQARLRALAESLREFSGSGGRFGKNGTESDGAGR